MYYNNRGNSGHVECLEMAPCPNYVSVCVCVCMREGKMCVGYLPEEVAMSVEAFFQLY